MSYNTKTTIKTWAEEDQPREKLLLKGKSSLSDAELLAILIGSGSTHLTAVDLCKIILNEYKNNLNELAKCSVNDFIKFKGIGEAKAVTIVAAIELGRRRKEEEVLKKIKISSSNEAYNFLKPYLMDLDHEQFWILLLNRNLELIKPIQISSGGVSGTIADPKIIFKYAIENLANAIILSHNHPSGNLKPSEADIQLTKKLKQASQLFDINLADHIIFTNHGFYSMSDQNIL
jgi:DNA repair protein RadC